MRQKRIIFELVNTLYVNYISHFGFRRKVMESIETINTGKFKEQKQNSEL